MLHEVVHRLSSSCLGAIHRIHYYSIGIHYKLQAIAGIGIDIAVIDSRLGCNLSIFNQIKIYTKLFALIVVKHFFLEVLAFHTYQGYFLIYLFISRYYCAFITPIH